MGNCIGKDESDRVAFDKLAQGDNFGLTNGAVKWDSTGVCGNAVLAPASTSTIGTAATATTTASDSPENHGANAKGVGSSQQEQQRQLEQQQQSISGGVDANLSALNGSEIGSVQSYQSGEPETYDVFSSDCSVGFQSHDVDSSVGSSGTGGHHMRNSSRGSRGGRLSTTNSIVGLDEMIESRKETGDLCQNVVHIEIPCGLPIEEVYDGVHTGPVLGTGISGIVRLVTHKATGIKYAVKCLDLDLIDTAEGIKQLREEISIMCQLDHPNIVRLTEVYESYSEIYLVQELCLGGELFDRLEEQPDYHYTEAQCAKLVKNMLSAVRYLHSKGIIHRDLKLENFLFSSTAPDSELKMIDFGLSKHFQYSGEVHHDAVGTPYTVAPEVIKGNYDEKCDVWAIGVITFLALSGDPPFGGCGGPESLGQIRNNILNGDFAFEPEDIWEPVSDLGKDFITKLLVVDPQHRLSSNEAQKHPWLKIANADTSIGDRQLNPKVVEALNSFKEFSEMRKLLCSVLSFTLLPDQIKELRKEFGKMDKDESGEISLAVLKEVLMTSKSKSGSQSALVEVLGDSHASLASLQEEDVEDIFNAICAKNQNNSTSADERKKNDNEETSTIHWHQFLAAGLSQCQVDDRNLRLAFDRLDSDHKGYITLEDIMYLMGTDALQDEQAIRRMWADSLMFLRRDHECLTYDDFLVLMHGQQENR